MSVKIKDSGNIRVATYPVDGGNFEASVTDYSIKVSVKERGETEKRAAINAKKKLKNIK
jgi:hypothetical protein